jgi:hypothetical protein
MFFCSINLSYFKDKNLKTKYLFICSIKPFRNISSHGSNKDIESRLKSQKYTVKIYFPKPQYAEIKEIVAWFVNEIYKRICKIKENNK